MEILEPFSEWSTRLQIKYQNGCIANILQVMNELKEILENAQLGNVQQYHSCQIEFILFNGLRILYAYYQKTEVCPAYIVAITLNPGMKLEYFEVQWSERPDAANLTKHTVNDI